jgi:type I restriction enzyme S subunit
MYGEGKTRGMHTELRISAATNQAVAALQTLNSIRSYLKLFLAKNYHDVRRAASGGVQPNLNLDVVRSIVLPFPPESEQSVIVESAEDQLSVIDHLESDLASKLAGAKALRQSILRHAFTGQLVPQDPKDEPASELLKRIAAEREARKRTKATPRKQTAKRQKREK